MPRVRRIVQRRDEFVEDVENVRQLVDDVVGNGAWAAPAPAWKLHAMFEVLAVRTYTAWETFARDIFILTLAEDTTQLAQQTGLSIKPQRVTTDMAEALLTARGYVEFKGFENLKAEARKWLGKPRSPFEKMQDAAVDAADDLRTLRNFVVHRSRQSEQSYQKLLRQRHVSGDPLPGEYLHAGAPATRMHGYLATLSSLAPVLVP